MTNILTKISLLFAKTFAITEVEPDASNADYKLVIMNKHTQECVVHYFFTMRDAVKFASPPNLFLGNGYDYFIYNRSSDNTEKFVKLNDSNKNNYYYGSNIARSY
jgi:hypothetical protein